MYRYWWHKDTAEVWSAGTHGGRWLWVPVCWLVHNGGGPSISGAWGCSYHGAGIWSMGATTTARVLGPGVCTGLREAVGSPGPRAAPSGEGRIRRSGISLPRGSCGDGCWVTPWWKRPASSVEWAAGARARYHYRLLRCESCGEAAAAMGAVDVLSGKGHCHTTAQAV